MAEEENKPEVPKAPEAPKAPEEVQQGAPEEAEEEIEQDSIYHFSKKVLFLSIIFLFINVAWYVLVSYSQGVSSFREVAPKLIFASNQEVMLKTPFDESFFAAQPNQILLTGTQLKTGQQSFAEVQIEGNNIVRLDENTEIRLLENNFQNPQEPRFVFELFAGSVWINAFDPVIVKTQRSEARYAHAVGVYTYSKPLSRVISIVGNVDLTLLGQNGEKLSEFVIPLKNQVAFTNSQIIPEYARLEYSKLRKELKMGPISKTILEESWVKRNTQDDAILYLAENDYIFSSSIYNLKDRYYSLREKISLIPSQKRIERFNQIKIRLQYLLGGIHKDGLDEEAERLLDEFDELANAFEGDPLLADIMERQFYAIRNVRTDTPAYDVKEYLRERLFTNDNPELFRTYLADLDFLLRVDEMKQAEKVAETWLEKWKLGIRQNNPDEFNQQARIYHNIMLAYVDKVDQKLLVVLDDAGNFRLEEAEDSEEALFEIALERLEMSKYLVAAYRYAEAKTYLKTSYADLNLAEQETSAAAREIFLKDASLIAERIAFAEQTLKGAASSISEEGFKDYLSTQKRDEDLAERFSALMEEAQQAEDEEEMIYPTVSDVSQQFTLSRIIVLDEDIETDPGLPFEFNILTARFLDRAKDGSSITFSARYDYSTNAVYDITLNDSPIRGSLAMDDFIRIAKEGVKEVEEVTPETELDDMESIADFLNLTESEEAERSQIIAQDLAKQLLLRELEGFKIFVSSTQQVVVLNPVTLNEFKVTDVSIQDPKEDRRVTVDFEYSSVTKTLSNIILKDVSASLPSQVKADEFISTVFGSLHAQEEEAKAVSETVSEFSKHNLLLAESDIRFVDGGRNQVEFKKVQIKSMPIEFAGVYYRPTETFLSAEHSLLTSQNIEAKEYLTQLSELFVIDYLSSKGVTISQENITNTLPDPKVVIKNYVRGDKVLDFTFNLSGNRLDKIKLQGTDVEVESMTFEEFSLIEGGEVGLGSQTQSQMDGNWSYITGSGIRSTPAIGNQGIIYIGSTDGKLYAFDPSGSLKWSYGTEVIFEHSPIIGSDGTIYITGHHNELNGLYAVNPDGTEKWAFEIEGSGNFIKTGLAIDTDGTIYFGSYNKKLYAINPDGIEKWTFEIGENIKSTPAAKNGTIYFGGDKKLYAINPDGTEKWTFEIGEKVEASPEVGSDGTVYIGSFDKKLYAINPDGTEKWTFSAGDSGEDIIISKPVIGSDGTIYFNSLANLFALSPDGTEKWSFRPDGSIYSIPSVGMDGLIYFGSEDQNLYALNQNGTKKWSYKAKAKVLSSAVVGGDGTVYFGSEDRRFYAIKNPQDRSAILINEEGAEVVGEEEAPGGEPEAPGEEPEAPGGEPEAPGGEPEAPGEEPEE